MFTLLSKLALNTLLMTAVSTEVVLPRIKLGKGKLLLVSGFASDLEQQASHVTGQCISIDEGGSFYTIRREQRFPAHVATEKGYEGVLEPEELRTIKSMVKELKVQHLHKFSVPSYPKTSGYVETATVTYSAENHQHSVG